jgi:hypothetical protein
MEKRFELILHEEQLKEQGVFDLENGTSLETDQLASTFE